MFRRRKTTMQKKKNKINYIVAALLVLLLVIAALATSAYSKYVRKYSAEFKADIVALGQVEIFLTETKVDEYGTPLTGAEAGTTNQGQAYKLVPGFTYTKDPLITVVSGSNPCWLFVEVKNDIEQFEASTNPIETQMLENGWTPIDGEENVYYHDIVDAFDAEQTVKVFEEFTIDGYANEVEGWDAVTPDSTTVTICAYAIQADGFNDEEKSKEENIASAWAALNANS